MGRLCYPQYIENLNSLEQPPPLSRTPTPGMVLDLCQQRKTFPLPKGQSWDVHRHLRPAGHIAQTCKLGRRGTEQCAVVIFLRSSKVSRAYHSRTLHTADRPQLPQLLLAQCSSTLLRPRVCASTSSCTSPLLCQMAGAA